MNILTPYTFANTQVPQLPIISSSKVLQTFLTFPETNAQENYTTLAHFGDAILQNCLSILIRGVLVPCDPQTASELRQTLSDDRFLSSLYDTYAFPLLFPVLSYLPLPPYPKLDEINKAKSDFIRAFIAALHDDYQERALSNTLSLSDGVDSFEAQRWIMEVWLGPLYGPVLEEAARRLVYEDD